MSEEYITGFVELKNTIDFTVIAKLLEKKYDIGVTPIDIRELNYYPVQFLPRSNYFAFCIADYPGQYETKLIDYYEYGVEADTNLPLKPDDRLNLLVNILIDIAGKSETNRMVIALFDYSLAGEIEKVRRIKIEELSYYIHDDVKANDGPPNTLYEITVDLMIDNSTLKTKVNVPC